MYYFEGEINGTVCVRNYHPMGFPIAASEGNKFHRETGKEPELYEEFYVPEYGPRMLIMRIEWFYHRDHEAGGRLYKAP